MSQLGKSNLNLNLNLNLGAASSGVDGTPPGVRINTQEFRKLASINALQEVRRTVQTVRYREFWNPELQANIYVDAFVRAYPRWLEKLTAERGLIDTLKNQLVGEIDHELKQVLDAAPERESRFAEIIHQDSAEGALSYWYGMLMLEPSAAPGTALLVRAARRIGELVVMCLKHHYRFPRPSQLCPAIVPMIDAPAHPSFPSGHSLQARLISRCLELARPDLPQAKGLLDDLAERIGHNRIIAGLHYPKDHEAGLKAADAVFEMLTANGPEGKPMVPAFADLVGVARGEFAPQGDPRLKPIA